MSIEEIQEEIFADNAVIDLFSIDEIRNKPNDCPVNIHADRKVINH
tara:strand:- start:3177 stop:3314 length:138 start_codon:yes stop_codon:yes gene_type:complete